MDRVLYIAMSGAKQNDLAMAASAHNMANVSTPGFRADFNTFRSLPVNGPGYASRVYAVSENKGTNLKVGEYISTGRDLDLALQGDGWITVVTEDGREGYTRAGDLRILPDGHMVNGQGHAVMGLRGPIVLPPSQKVDIGVDGSISVVPEGQLPTNIAVIDQIKLVNPLPIELFKDDDGLMRLKSGDVAEPDINVQLVSGMLEGSNVNVVEALVNMITYARQFEIHVKMMKAAEEMDVATQQMMRMS